MILATAPIDPRRAALVARTMFRRVSSLAMLCAPYEPSSTLLAFATNPKAGQLPVDCDLSELAQRLSIDGECRTVAVFCADHYTMSGYRVFTTGRLEGERIYWEETEAGFGADAGPDTVVEEGLARLASIPDGRSLPDLLQSVPDRWLVLRQDARDVIPPRAPVTWEHLHRDLDLELCWAMSFDATHGMRHMLRSRTLPGDLLRGLTAALRK